MTAQLENLSFDVSAQDINLVLNVINTVSTRGAFQPEEFQIVGALFERLKTLITVQEEKEQLEFDLTPNQQ